MGQMFPSRNGETVNYHTMPIPDRDKLHTFLVAQFTQAYESDAFLLVGQNKNGHPREVLEDVAELLELDPSIYQEMEILDSRCVQDAIKAIENFRVPTSQVVKTGANAKSRAKKAEKSYRDKALRMSMKGKQGQKPNKGGR